MITKRSITNNSTYYHLIATWVICEAFLGGIIHGLRIPVSGLVVGSCAVICISLIAWYVPVRGAILKATLIVAIFKMMLSPQAPPPAYIAVFFQGLLGELLFFNRRFFKLSCILLGSIALLESGLQRILVLTIVYGNDLWKVINDSLNGLTKQKLATNYSLFIGGVYITLHVVTGLIIGWWSAVLPQRIEKWKNDPRYVLPVPKPTVVTNLPGSRRSKRKRIGMLIIWISLIALYVQSYFNIGTPLLPSSLALKIFLRSLIIVFAWIFIVAPLSRQLLHYWLRKKQVRSQHDIKQVLELLPGTISLVAQSWAQSKGGGLQRIIEFNKILLTSLFPPPVKPKLYILAAPIQSGKTSSLLEWSEGRHDVYGILTPIINGQRVFMDAHTREHFPMEAIAGEQAYEIGRYRFSRPGFERAEKIILSSLDKPGWLLIDEIGPLELRGEGFSYALRKLLETRNGKTLLVIREKEEMVAKVCKAFSIPDPILSNSLFKRDISFQ